MGTTVQEWEDQKAKERIGKAHCFVVAAIRLASDAHRLDPSMAGLEKALSELIKVKHLLARKV